MNARELHDRLGKLLEERVIGEQQAVLVRLASNNMTLLTGIEVAPGPVPRSVVTQLQPLTIGDII